MKKTYLAPEALVCRIASKQLVLTTSEKKAVGNPVNRDLTIDAEVDVEW